MNWAVFLGTLFIRSCFRYFVLRQLFATAGGAAASPSDFVGICNGVGNNPHKGAGNIPGSRTYPVRGFWHIGALSALTGPNWKRIVKNQLSTIEKSGMLSYGIVEGIEVNIIGQKPPWDLSFPSFYNVSYGGPDVEQYEFPTLSKLVTYCRLNPEARVFYFHNKGVTYNPPWEAVEAWREYMEYYIIERYQDCLYELEKDDIAVCSQGLRDYPCTHFSGNFYWTRCDYLNKLPAFNTSSRYEAEFWISKGISGETNKFDGKLHPISSLKACDSSCPRTLHVSNLYEVQVERSWYQDCSSCGPAQCLSIASGEKAKKA